MRHLLALALLLSIGQAVVGQTNKKIQVRTAADVNPVATNHQAVLTWVNPTTCTDGSPCTPNAINIYKFVGTCSAPMTQFTKLTSVAGNVKTYTDGNLAAATSYCYYVTASLPLPAAWDATVTYTGGQTVSYQGGVYVALNNASANLNQVPSSSPNFWATSSVESAGSNAVGGFTGTTGPPAAPANLTVTVQ